MPLREFVGGPDIEQRHAAFAQPAQQFVARDGFEAVAPVLAVGNQAPHLTAIVLRHRVQRVEQAGDRRGAQAVVHMLAVAAGGHESRPAQLLQMLRRVGHRQASQFSQPLDRTLTLRDVFQQDQAMGIAQGAGKFGQFGGKRGLDGWRGHWRRS